MSATRCTYCFGGRHPALAWLPFLFIWRHVEFLRSKQEQHEALQQQYNAVFQALSLAQGGRCNQGDNLTVAIKCSLPGHTVMARIVGPGMKTAAGLTPGSFVKSKWSVTSMYEAIPLLMAVRNAVASATRVKADGTALARHAGKHRATTARQRAVNLRGIMTMVSLQVAAWMSTTNTFLSAGRTSEACTFSGRLGMSTVGEWEVRIHSSAHFVSRPPFGDLPCII
jgi:hypothetical protein